METVIIPALEEWSADKRRQQVCDELISFRIPAGMVQTVDEVAHCKHLSAREFFVTVDDDVAGERHYPRLPALFSDFKADHRRSPRLGEHTREVLEGIGIGMEEIASLRLAGVIG
jgi:formyl-CoA transferase